MNKPDPSIKVNVDVTNPGQFFACCGLIELADRLWPGAEGWFEEGVFFVAGTGSLQELMQKLIEVEIKQLDPDSNTSSPVGIGGPFHLRLDWWHDTRAGGKELKVWAGTMESVRIARAMRQAVSAPEAWNEELLNFGTVAYDVEKPTKKVEPYYFDARRGPNAHSRDVGFSANSLGLTTTAMPAVELLCLIGLQRCLPLRTNMPRIFDYFVWSHPVTASLLPASVAGLLCRPATRGYRFENWYRTGQKKHKAFLPAVPLQETR